MRGTPAVQTVSKKKTSAPKPPPKVIPDPKDGIYTQYVALSHLAQWPKNPKRHDIPGIQASIGRFGYVAPIVIDEKSGRMVAGHGRLEALSELKKAVDKKEEGAERPKNVIEKDGEWYVPLLRGNSFKSELEAEAYLIADNRHVETGGWDDDLLRDIMRKFKDDPNLEAIGWTQHELDLLLKPPVVADASERPEHKMVGFMASEIKQIVLMLPGADYETTLNRLSQVMEKNKLKSHTEAVLHLLNFYEARSRA